MQDVGEGGVKIIALFLLVDSYHKPSLIGGLSDQSYVYFNIIHS